MCMANLQGAKLSKPFSAYSFGASLDHDALMREMAEKMGLPGPEPTHHTSTYISRRGGYSV